MTTQVRTATTTTIGVWFVLAVVAATVTTGSLVARAYAQAVQVTVRELTPDFTWGYRKGVKQPLGAFKNGLSLHQLTRATGDPPIGPLSIPDYVLWVDETTDTFGYEIEPTGAFSEPWHNSGGQMVFGEDGTIWFVHGAHLPENPMKLCRSDTPYDPSVFRTMVDPLVVAPIGSTTPCLTASPERISFFWRNGRSSLPNTTIRFRRDCLEPDFTLTIELEGDLGIGEAAHPTLGDLGLEQLWTRYDPRHGITCVSWQWFQVSVHRFGSLPFLYTDDGGTTWRRADGSALTALPVRYSDPVLIPDDHLANPAHAASWHPAQIGVTPEGAPWMAEPHGAIDDWEVWFWRFGVQAPGEDPAWHSTPISGPMIEKWSSYACGATRSHMVCVFADQENNNLLQARFSEDDGRTWGEPVVVDTLPAEGPEAGGGITWASFVQPADAYDDAARFFYTYHRLGQNSLASTNHRNKVRFIRLGFCVADFNNDADVGFFDLTALLSSWGTCVGCPDDLDQNGGVGLTDLSTLLSSWGPCP